jgi:MFS family permease
MLGAPGGRAAKEGEEMTVRNDLQGKLSESTAYLRRVVAASMAGTVVEWYEFFLYGTAATLVFSKVFFPRGGNELDAILAAFVTYAVGFAARPLGGVVFGQLGDRYGRKKLLQFSLLLVGAATFAMGCLPTFTQIGYWAPALLVVLRFVQGFAVGGEWAERFCWLPSTARSPAADSGPAGRRPVSRAETCWRRRCCWFSPRRCRTRRS